MILILVQNPVLPEATLSKPGRFFKKLLVFFYRLPPRCGSNLYCRQPLFCVIFR